MRIWRLLLILLLSLAVPAFGLGAADACVAHVDMSMDESGASSPRCDPAGASGQLPDDACATYCSLSSGCGSAQFLPPFDAPMPVLAADPQWRFGASPPIVAPDPFGAWRPPRLL